MKLFQNIPTWGSFRPYSVPLQHYRTSSSFFYRGADIASPPHGLRLICYKKVQPLCGWILQILSLTIEQSFNFFFCKLWKSLKRNHSIFCKLNNSSNTNPVFYNLRWYKKVFSIKCFSKKGRQALFACLMSLFSLQKLEFTCLIIFSLQKIELVIFALFICCNKEVNHLVCAC